MRSSDIASRFDEIYGATSRAALALITARCARTADIADIYQDTYLEVYRALCRRGTGYVANDRAFVLRIARQKLSRHYALSERLRMFVPMTGKNREGEEFDVSDLEVDAFLTEDFAVDHILLKEARAMIRQKPEDVKKVFYLFYDVGLRIPEIARLLGMGESSVKNKLYRTLKELRNLLEGGDSI